MPNLPTTPQRGLSRRRDVERLFDRFFTEWPLAATTEREAGLMWTPSLDFSENEKEYLVRVEAPGMTRDDLDVSLDGQMLTISGHRAFEKEEKEEEFFWREREEGRFVRTIRLPSAVKGDTIDAAYKEGVLTVRLPKAAPAARNRIPVK